ncbi:MAG: hypothetical protein WBA74_17925, partial [Cyclobacteriaceae bacterium]
SIKVLYKRHRESIKVHCKRSAEGEKSYRNELEKVKVLERYTKRAKILSSTNETAKSISFNTRPGSVVDDPG